jgi:hypothetical protein
MALTGHSRAPRSDRERLQDLFTVTGQDSVASVALPDVQVVVSNLFPA